MRATDLHGSKTPPNQDPVYMGPDQGPFRCDNCEYFRPPVVCIKREMIKAQGEHFGATVDPKGCCNYYEKK